MIIAPVVFFALADVAAPEVSPAPDPTSLLDRAIKAAGGEAALRRATVLKWRGRAFVYPGDRRIELEGSWIVEPPDRAVVTTWETDMGKESTRRLILLGSEGGLERAGERKPMPPEMLASERDQFYLYSVMRLLPLREPGVRLTAAGPRSLRVERDGRPDVELTFDGSGSLDRLRAELHDPVSGGKVVEKITFTGLMEAGGVRWPRRISITRDGAPFFDLELTDFAIGSSAELSREAERK